MNTLTAADSLQAGRVDPAEAYRQHRAVLFNYFRRCGLPSQAAEDQLQSVFVVLLESMHRYDPARGSLRSFLFGVARNLRLAWRRRNPEAFPSRGLPEAGTHRDATESAALRQAVSRLPDDQREALVLREFHGFDYAEIGAMQGIPVGTVRSRLFRAREALRRQLCPDEET
jgi:RNA polymerase sigma-70 factor (ECF subfamily)